MDEDSARSDLPPRPPSRRQGLPPGQTPDGAPSWPWILERYGRAALRFLLLYLDETVARDLYRRFFRDRLQEAPTPGPIRLLLGPSLIRLVAPLLPPLPKEATPPLHLSTPPPPVSYGPCRGDPRQARFDALWREVLLAHARHRLKELEERSGDPLDTALRLRAEAPGLSSAELAERIGLERRRPLSADEARQTLQRAQAAFSRLLLDEVVATLPGCATVATVEDELIATGLLASCREAFNRYRPGPGRGR